MPTGLDALIRQTIDIQDLEKEEQRGIRRLTVAVDREKLEKLTAIARMENAYLKDLLLELIDDYISEYADQKGLPLQASSNKNIAYTDPIAPKRLNAWELFFCANAGKPYATVPSLNRMHLTLLDFKI